MGKLSLPDRIRLQAVLCGLLALALITGCGRPKTTEQNSNSSASEVVSNESIRPTPEQQPDQISSSEKIPVESNFDVTAAIKSTIRAFENAHDEEEDAVATTIVTLSQNHDTQTVLNFITRLYETADEANNTELAFITHLNANSFITGKLNGAGRESDPTSRKALLDTLSTFSNKAFIKKQWTLAQNGYFTLASALEAETTVDTPELVKANLRIAIISINTRRHQEALKRCKMVQNLLITGTGTPTARRHQIEAYYLAAVAHSEMGEAVEVLASAKIAKELLAETSFADFTHVDVSTRDKKWLNERLSLLEGRSYTQLKRVSDAYNSLRENLPAQEEIPDLAVTLTALEAVELADYYGYLADAALTINKHEDAISALERKLAMESAAIEKTFRAGSLDERIRATRDRLTRLYLGSGKTEKVAERLVERLQNQQDAFLERAPTSQQLNEWIETLGQLARTRLTAGRLPQMALDFASALAMAEALSMASENDPSSEMTALPFEVELLQLDIIEDYLAEKHSQPSSMSPQMAATVRALDEASIELQEKIAARLSELAKDTSLPFPSRARIVKVLLRRGDRLLKIDLREALYTYQQARYFVSPDADLLYTETPTLRAAILLRIGTIQEKRGDLANARTSLSSALEALAFLPMSEMSKNADTMETLAQTHRQLGKLYRAESDMDNARQHFSKALEIAKTLWDTGGADLEKSENLAGLYNETAEVALHFSQFDVARSLLAKEQELRIQLARYPNYNTPTSQLALLRNYRLLAECALGMSDWSECSSLVATANRALDRTPDMGTAGLDWHNERLRIAEVGGMVKLTNNLQSEALEVWRKALDLPIGEAIGDRQTALRQRELMASIWERIASTEESLRNVDGAIDALLQVYRRVSENQPVFTPGAPPRLDPRAIAGRLANLYGSQNKLSEALRFSLIERDYLDTLLRQFPRHPVFILELQRTNEKAATYAIRQGLHSEARDYLDEALTLNNALRERSPNDMELMQDRDRLTNMRAGLNPPNP